LYRKTVLANGLRILTETMSHTRSVSICAFIGVGSRYESDARAGISHFVEHVLFRGTDKRPTSHAISEAIEGVGGMLNGGTDRESTVYWCKVPQPHFNMALDVLSDILLHSRFVAEDIEKERQVIIEEINMSYDNPSQRVGQLIDDVMWPGHPLGRDIAGSKASVSSIKRRDLLSYIKKAYLPLDTVISIAGNIQHKEAISVVTELLGEWTGTGQCPSFKNYREKPAARLVVETRDIEQVHLCLALPGLSRVHPQRFVLDLLNVVLGEGMSSRLFTEIRDQLGLAYSIFSFVDHLADSGALTVYAGIEPRRLEEAVKAISRQFIRFSKEIISDAEMNKARELTKGQLLLRLEDSRHVASWNGGQEVLTGQVRTVDEVVAILDGITAGDIQKLARQMIVKDRLRLAIIGPVKRSKTLEGLIGQ
jgi:predicted Zn-dependent peptidase